MRGFAAGLTLARWLQASPFPSAASSRNIVLANTGPDMSPSCVDLLPPKFVTVIISLRNGISLLRVFR